VLAGYGAGLETAGVSAPINLEAANPYKNRSREVRLRNGGRISFMPQRMPRF
jgi:hypothetical protein